MSPRQPHPCCTLPRKMSICHLGLIQFLTSITTCVRGRSKAICSVHHAQMHAPAYPTLPLHMATKPAAWAALLLQLPIVPHKAHVTHVQQRRTASSQESMRIPFSKRP